MITKYLNFLTITGKVIPVIYFAQAESVGHIKIGFTEGIDVNDRLQQLQPGCPVKMILLGTIPGGRETEADLHKRFAFAHVHGEWFRPVPELLAFIGTEAKDWREGPAGVQSRFVQIKVLTVGSKQMTAALFRQLPEGSIVNWKATDPDDGFLVTYGEPWGKVINGKECEKDGRFWVVFECAGILYRTLTAYYDSPPSFPQYGTSVERDRWRKLSDLWKAYYRELTYLEQLFIGVG